MRQDTIQDKDIPTADPEKVILQYTPLLHKICKRYQTIIDRSGAIDTDDLLQAGRIAICKAQQTYDPEGGASFCNYVYDRIRGAMRLTAGINPNTGAAPEQMEYLDAPITDDSGNETSMIDLIPDPNADTEAAVLDPIERSETQQEVRAAVDRLKSDAQREAVSKFWLEGKSKNAAADEMNMDEDSFKKIERTARSTLRRDWQLKEYAISVLYFHVGVNRFNTTWTSATEQAALWYIENYPDKPETARQEYE